MTKEQLTTLLNGREIGDEITDEEELEAKKSGLVVVFGAFDDLVEFRGAIHDEANHFDGGTVLLDKDGLLTEFSQIDNEDEDALEEYFRRKKGKISKIEALWCPDKIYSWKYATSIPHAEFDIKEGDELYCRGIVFEIKSIQ